MTRSWDVMGNKPLGPRKLLGDPGKLAEYRLYGVIANAVTVCWIGIENDDTGERQRQLTPVVEEAKAECDYLRAMYPEENYEVCEVRFSLVPYEGPSNEGM